MKILILGIGMGPQHVTAEVADALHSADYMIAARKSDDDGLLAVRRVIADSFGLEVVAVDDPERERAHPVDYPGAVAAWHSARAAMYEPVLRARGGTAAFLVWGDPSLYDSTIRVVEQLAARMPVEYDVLPGVSAPQLLAARHRVVLNEIGRQLHITIARRLREAVDAGQDNILVMLGHRLDLSGLGDWSVWWGANLGTPSEELASGRVADVQDEIMAARDRAKAAAGWVLDICLLRRSAE